MVIVQRFGLIARPLVILSAKFFRECIRGIHSLHFLFPFFQASCISIGQTKIALLKGDVIQVLQGDGNVKNEGPFEKRMLILLNKV